MLRWQAEDPQVIGIDSPSCTRYPPCKSHMAPGAEIGPPRPTPLAVCMTKIFVMEVSPPKRCPYR
jgi:hypothetical protein